MVKLLLFFRLNSIEFCMTLIDFQGLYLFWKLILMHKAFDYLRASLIINAMRAWVIQITDSNVRLIHNPNNSWLRKLHTHELFINICKWIKPDHKKVRLIVLIIVLECALFVFLDLFTIYSKRFKTQYVYSLRSLFGLLPRITLISETYGHPDFKIIEFQNPKRIKLEAFSWVTRLFERKPQFK